MLFVLTPDYLGDDSAILSLYNMVSIFSDSSINSLLFTAWPLGNPTFDSNCCINLGNASCWYKDYKILPD